MTTFPIYLNGDASDHAKRALELEAVLLQCRKHLRVQLISVGSGISAEAALAYIAVLADAPCEVTVASYGNLAGAGAFALWLAAAPVRTIRPNGWVYVPTFADLADPDRGESRPLLAPSVPAEEWDYDACLRIIDEHVALDLVLGNRLTARDLRELYLLDTGDLLFGDETMANTESRTNGPGNKEADRDGLVW